MYLLSAIWVGLELSGCLFFNGAFLQEKRRKPYAVRLVVVAWLIMSIYANIPISNLVKQIITILIFTFLSVLFYNGKSIDHLFLTIICYIFITVIDSMFLYGGCALLKLSYAEFVWRKLSYSTLITVDKLLVVFLAWLLFRFRSKGDFQGANRKWLSLSILFPGASVAMLVVLFFNSQNNEDLSLSTVVFSIILAIANMAMLYIITAIEKTTKQEKEMGLLRQQIELQTENYNALKESYSLQRKSTHEFERYMQVLRDLLDRKEYITASNLVDQLQNDRTLRIFSINSKHPVIDVILNQKHQLAQKHGIKMRVQVNDLSQISIQTDSLVVLLSNLLDNAIEACQRHTGRKEIFCSIIFDDGVYIAIRNTSSPVDIQNGKIATSKKNTSEHGYGIPAIKFILEQLKAEYTFEYNDGWFQFVAEIP